MKRSGFMLIELAVASFVIGVAVLALAAILHIGQRAATVSDGTTRAALFADDALATIRLLNDRAAADEDPDAWVKLWKQLGNGTVITQLTGFASNVWTPDQTRSLPCLDTSPGVHTNFWCPSRVSPEGDEANLVRADFALRYAFSFASSDDMEDTGRGSERPRYCAITLHVWSGISLAAETSETTFFAVYSNPRRMP